MGTAHLYCIHCGGVYPPQAKYCRFCGKPIYIPPEIENQSIPPEIENQLQKGMQNITPNVTPNIASVAVLSEEDSRQTTERIIKGRYRLETCIGSGGYGKVYEGVDTTFMNRKVAIKEMIQHGLSEKEIDEASESFKREASLLASLTHPNLPSIYDFFLEGTRWYLVMSFIEGMTLSRYVQRKGGRLSIEKVLQIGIQLATVLSYLHTRKPPIIFRDLKPENIMYTPQGQIYLIDFGIARHFKFGQTKDTMILGSPGYAAPEQYGRAQTTPQADIYSMGALLHELISGLDPSLIPFAQKPLHLPQYPQLSVLIRCMLEMDIKRRPISMGNIQRELQRIATGRVGLNTTQHAVVVPGPVYLPAPNGARRIARIENLH